ncbi:HWE histidine kinase domain-containing protein [Caulobacter sp.]|uniref:HWE histidine kinase domain-containing protein n=1 Tax=Caulobacter sp. TaxID=78 RepID=UPI0016182FC2
MIDESPPLSASPSVTTALKHAPLGIAIFDSQMRYLAASRQYLTDQHLPADMPLIGRLHYEAFPEVPQKWRDLHARVLAEGVELRHEGDPYIDRYGNIEWIRWSMAPWRTDANERGESVIGGLVLYTEVVTANIEARQKLEAAEARYRAVFDQAAMGVARLTPIGEILEVNDSFCALLQRPREALLGASFQSLAHADHLEEVLASSAALLAGERETCSAERLFVTPGGDVWIHLTASMVRVEDEPAYILAIISDISARKEAETATQRHQGQLRLLINELNHRVKNTLATVQSMAAQTLRNEPHPTVAFEKFEARLLGLSGVHDILTRESWHGAALHEVAQRALRPFDEAGVRVSVAGPAVRLQPGGALTMALIFHELATNALKYGALSNAVGRVSLTWTYDPATRLLETTWTEHDGPTVIEPTRKGFGSRLIERSLRGELKGQADMDYRPEGLRCVLHARLPEAPDADPA